MNRSAATPVVCSLTLSPDLAEVSRARRFLEGIASESGFPGSRIFDITVACSEAIANAIEHASPGEPVEVKARRHADRLEVEIEGPGEFQLPRRAGEHPHRGLGLPIMASLSDHLALYSGPRGGTLVTLSFYLRGALPLRSALPPSLLEALSENTLLSSVLDQMLDAFLILDDEWRYAYVNDAAAKLFELPKERLIGQVAWDIFPSTVGGRFWEECHRVVSERAPVLFEEFLAHRGLWYENRCFPIEGGVAVFIRDITARKKAEADLRASEERYRDLFASIDDAFVLCDVLTDENGVTDYRFLEVNPAGERYLGKPKEEVIGQLGSSLLPHPKDQALETLARVAATGESLRLENYSADLDKWFDMFLFKTSCGQVAYLSRDITDRKRAEVELRESRDLLSIALGTARLAVWEVDPLSGEFTITPEIVSVFGLEDESLVGSRRSWKDLVVKEDRSRVQAVLDDALAGRPSYDIEFRLRSSREKRLIWVEAQARSHAREDGSMALIGVARDVSERKCAEEALRESEHKLRVLAAESERLYQQQLDIARDLQDALTMQIPSSLGPVQVAHLYHSATEAAHVGGDFYDVFEIKDGKVAVLIGDVSGHGVGASRTATLVKDVILAFAQNTQRPELVLKSTNDLLIEKSLTDFITVFLGIVDPRKGTMSYAAAGHPEPVLKGARGEGEHLGGGGFPLGIFPEASWLPRSVKVRPGDLLVLYTDGVTEARRNGELFGEERLRKTVAANSRSLAQLPQSILDEILAFTRGVLLDDVAVLAVSFDPTEP